MVSSYPTWSARTQTKEERLFRFKDERVPRLHQKRRARRGEGLEVEEEEDGDDDEDSAKHKRVHSYTPLTVDEKDIRFLSSGSREIPDGNLVTFKLSDERFKDIKFDWLIADEAHCVKKLTGSYYNMTRLFSWERLVWVTGTPLCSSLRDILTPLNMMWDKYNYD